MSPVDFSIAVRDQRPFMHNLCGRRDDRWHTAFFLLEAQRQTGPSEQHSRSSCRRYDQKSSYDIKKQQARLQQTGRDSRLTSTFANLTNDLIFMLARFAAGF